MRFWDASGVVPLLIREQRTAIARALLAEDPRLAVWWVTRTECVSALARRARSGDMDAVAGVQARARLDRRQAAWLEVAPSVEIRLTAERLLGVHPLRTADAFQLAAALDWAAPQPAGAGFVCFDNRLRQAAQREGFTVLPERV